MNVDSAMTGLRLRSGPRLTIEIWPLKWVFGQVVRRDSIPRLIGFAIKA